jgi:hypothetical protein
MGFPGLQDFAVDEITIISRDDEKNILNRFAAHYDAPAYARRALRVQQAYEELLSRCRRKRDQWLEMVRLRLGVLRALAEDFSRLSLVAAATEQIDTLRGLHDELQPRLRVPVRPTSSIPQLRQALQDLDQSILRFNRRWHKFVHELDLTAINQLREGYNRYYLLEKECAVRSVRLARQGFARLAPLRAEDLIALLPLLPVLHLHE